MIKVKQQEIHPNQIMHVMVDILIRMGHSDENIVDLLDFYGIESEELE